MDYITIIQGDDTNFLGDQFLVINFNTDIDLSGFTATFTLGDVTLTYGDLSGKNFEVILSDEITSNLKLGKQYGELKLIDTQQRIRTVTSVIPFLIRKGVNEEIRFVNNSLEVSMNINDTVLNVLIETPGIARVEATRMMSYCNDAKVSAQSYANEAHNTHIQLNQDVDAFYGRMANFDDIVADAYQTCVDNITTINETRDIAINEVETLGNQKIASATEQASIATQKTQEVSNTYTTAMSDIATARSNSLNDIDNKKNDSILDIEDKRVSSVNSVENTAELGRDSLTEIANELLYKWNLFDLIQKDHLLLFSETQGLALLGSYVYKEAIAGTRYGYPNFYERCVNEKNNSIQQQITLGNYTVNIYVNSNGHKYYDIADKYIIDEFYTLTGVAWYYGIDTVNERIFLPRNNYFFKSSSVNEIGSKITPQLPNIKGRMVDPLGGNGSASIVNGAFMQGALNRTATTSAIDYDGYDILFDASKYNSIYSNGGTVVADGVNTIIYMVVGNTVNDEGLTDLVNQATNLLSQLNTGLNTRALLDFSNSSPCNSFFNNIASKIMPAYDSQISGTLSSWIQCFTDSFVCVWGNDPYTENYYAYVSPNAGTTKYIVGRRYDDTNGNTEGTSFTFFVPQNWYFYCSAEGAKDYRIYPLIGAL